MITICNKSIVRVGTLLQFFLCVCLCVCLNYEEKCYHIARKCSIFSKLTIVICKQYSAVEYCLENVVSQVHQWRCSSGTWETGLDYMLSLHFSGVLLQCTTPSVFYVPPDTL